MAISQQAKYFALILLLNLSYFAQAIPWHGLEEQVVQTVTIWGELVHSDGKLPALQIAPNPLITVSLTQEAERTANNQFKIELSLPTPIFAQFLYGNQMLTLFLEPGDSLHLTADAVNLAQTVRFAGVGAAHNSFLSAYYKKFHLQGKLFNEREALQYPPLQYQQYTDSLRLDRQSFVQRYTQVQDFSRQFLHLIYADIDYNYAYNRIAYAQKKRSGDLPTDYYAFLKQIKLDDDQILLLPSFGDFLIQYTKDKFEREIVQRQSNYDFDNYYAEYYDFVDHELKNGSRYLTLAKILMEGIKSGKVEVLLPKFKAFAQQKDYPVFNNVVEIYHNKAKKTAAGSRAPNFTLQNAKGKSVSLSDFRNQPVCIQFCASWSEICRPNVGLARKIKRIYGNQVAFIFVSFDHTTEEWQKSFKKHSKIGTRLIALQQMQQLERDYNINSLPKYLVVDSEGIIADSNFNPENFEKITVLLNKLVQK